MVSICQRTSDAHLAMIRSATKALSGHSLVGYWLDREAEIHYENTPMQYTVIFHGCKNVDFQMKNEPRREETNVLVSDLGITI